MSEYQNSKFDMYFSMSKQITDDFDLDFNLSDIPGAGDLFADGLPIELSSEGTLSVDTKLDFDLNFSVDLSNLSDVQVVLYDDSQVTFDWLRVDTDPDDPIDITASIMVDGSPAISLAVIEPEIDIDLAGTISLVEDPEDNLYHISELGNLELWNIDLVGDLYADLPIYFPSGSTPLGGTDLDGKRGWRTG